MSPMGVTAVLMGVMGCELMTDRHRTDEGVVIDDDTGGDTATVDGDDGAAAIEGAGDILIMMVDDRVGR